MFTYRNHSIFFFTYLNSKNMKTVHLDQSGYFRNYLLSIYICASFTGDLTALKESEVKYRQQYAEASHREKVLVRRLASKESELQEYIVSNNFVEVRSTSFEKC